MSNPDWRRLSSALLTLAAIWLGGKYILPLAMPFFLGFLLALAAEPAVRFLERRSPLGAGLSVFIGVTATLALVTLLGLLLISLLVRELGTLASILPDLEATARRGLSSLEHWLLGLSMAAPDNLRPLLTRSVLGLFDGGSDLYDRAIAQLPALATGVLSHVPEGLLSLGTGLLSAYLISARMPRLRTWIQSRFPQERIIRWKTVLSGLKQAILGWLRAQLKLMVLTFSLVCAGLLLLRIPFAPVWAALIALVDAVPMLGTGLVMVPWSLICLLEGNAVRALGMLGIFAAATLSRSVLEPRFLGRQLGLDPLVTLAALYLGYRLFGFPGLLFSPVLAVILIQLIRSAPKEDKL